MPPVSQVLTAAFSCVVVAPVDRGVDKKNEVPMDGRHSPVVCMSTMSTAQELYAAARQDLAALAGPLFELSEKRLRERGYFLPHAGVLTTEGRVALLDAMCSTPGGFANSDHILPMLRDGLRSMAGERDLKAIAIAEIVSAIPNAEQTRAIKVLIEHQLGLTIVFYMSITQTDVGAYLLGKTLTFFTEPEIHAWR
jgi:hypothetical protein